MENPQLWKLCQDANQLLMRVYLPGLQEAAHESGLEDREWAGWILPAYTIDPHPINAQLLRIRSAYTNPALLTARLNMFTGRGYLTAQDNGYRLTEKGYSTVRSMISAVETALDQIQSFDAVKLSLLDKLLGELLQQCLTAQNPEQKWCLINNRGNLDLSEKSSLVKIDQSLSDLFAWRDDCHLAAWQPYHYIHGFVWESFTLIWKKEAGTVTEICSILGEKRGFDKDEYQLALDELRIRGWVKENSGKYDITPAGNKVRQSAEDFTEELFYQPIVSVGISRLKEVENLLAELISFLRKSESVL
jgi:ribosomal protein S19E (S16A)